MVPAPVDRVALKVAQGVVHPSHVPFEAEAEAAVIRRARDAAARRCSPPRSSAPRAPARDRRVEVAQEGDRFEVLPSAIRVGEPLAVLARIIQIEHRRDGIDAQAVEVKFLQPVESGGEEEVAHFVAAVIEDERAPVRVFALARVLVLVEARAVEACERRARPSGKCAGTQSRMTPSPRWWARSTNAGIHPGFRSRQVGAKYPVTW